MPTIGLAQSSQSPFLIKITAKQAEVKRGSEVTVNVTLTNVSKRDITFEDTSACDHPVEVRDHAGKLVPDTEYKRALNCGGAEAEW